MTVGYFTRMALLLIFLINAQSCGYPNSSATEGVLWEKGTGWKTHDACRLALRNIDDAAIQKIQQRINRGVNVAAWFEHLGWAYFKKATDSFDENYYALAQRVASCLQAIQPDNPEALLLNGFVAINMHDFLEAEKTARLLTESRDYWADYALLGDALLEQGDLDASQQAYQALMDRRPGPQAYARAAELNRRRGQLHSAIEFMHLALTATSQQDKQARAWALAHLAELYLQDLNYPLASRYAQQALAINADYAPLAQVAAKAAMTPRKKRLVRSTPTTGTH